MRGKRGVSFGTILTLLLTAAVIAGCVVVFAKIETGNPRAHMSAQKVFGLMGDALNGTTPVPVPEATVRTVTVTLAPAPSPTAAPHKTTQAPKKKTDAHSFTLTVGGLVAFESEISDSVYNKSQKTFNYKDILSLIREKMDGDMNLISLGQVINTEDQKYGDALAPQSIVAGIKAAGIDDVLLNTSHVLDQDIQGVNGTVSSLTKEGLSCGGVTAGSAQQNRMIQLNGAKIALLAYTESLTAKGKINREKQPKVMTLYSQQQAQKDLAAARKNGADFIIVSMYWGKKDTTGITSAMRSTAAFLAENGADLVLGYQPSRVLPMETMSVPDENGIQRQCLIAYSMGTLLGESREKYDISGILLHLKVSCSSNGAEYDLMEYTPTYICRQKISSKIQYRVVSALDAPPDFMEAKQKEYMANALKRIRTTLESSPVTERK